MMIGALGLTCGISRAQDVTQYQRVLFIGDSITLHGPAANLGWSGNWGMAASAEDKDYVHLFIAKLTQARNGSAPIVAILGGGGGKVTDKVASASSFTDFHADLAVVQLGENDNTNVNEEGFQRPYEGILAAIQAGNPKVRILCTGVWGYPLGNPEKNRMIRAACDKFGATYVDLGKITPNPAARVLLEKRFTNAAVNWHPGDVGQAGYADALWDALTGPAPAVTASTAAAPAVTSVSNSVPPIVSNAEKPPTIDELWTGSSGLNWQPQPTVENEQGHPVVRINVTDPTQALMLGAPLDTTVCNGHFVVIETRVRGEGISPKPNHWNGVKVMLQIGNAEGKYDYPQAYLPDGTFDWMPARLVERIPDNTVSLALRIGLENVSGTAFFDSLHITISTNEPPAPPQASP